MRAINSPYGGAKLRKQTGLAAVEFALVALSFLMLVFGILEVARAMYICNTLQEVTRRAAELATNTDFTDAAALQRIRETAVLRSSPGYLVFAEPVTDAHIKIDYMSISSVGSAFAMSSIPKGSLPSSPVENEAICMRNANNASCIRLVRVRVCAPSGGNDCDPVPYQSIVSLIPLPFSLPKSTTISHAETLGRSAGLPPGP